MGFLVGTFGHDHQSPRHAQMDDELGAGGLGVVVPIGPGVGTVVGHERQQQKLAATHDVAERTAGDKPGQLIRVRRFARRGASGTRTPVTVRPGSTATNWRRTVSTSGSSGMSRHSLRFQPVRPLLDVDDERHRQLDDVGHAVANERGRLRHLIGRQLQH